MYSFIKMDKIHSMLQQKAQQVQTLCLSLGFYDVVGLCELWCLSAADFHYHVSFLFHETISFLNQQIVSGVGGMELSLQAAGLHLFLLAVRPRCSAPYRTESVCSGQLLTSLFWGIGCVIAHFVLWLKKSIESLVVVLCELEVGDLHYFGHGVRLSSRQKKEKNKKVAVCDFFISETSHVVLIWREQWRRRTLWVRCVGWVGVLYVVMRCYREYIYVRRR